MAREIPLTRGKVALVDDDDYEELMQYRWRAHYDRHVWYARRALPRGSSPSTLAMHRQLLNAPTGMLVDHRDGDGLNNQRANLRLVDAAGNREHAVVRSDSKQRYRGVERVDNSSKFLARIVVRGKRYNLGYYDTQEQAADAYNEASVRLRS